MLSDLPTAEREEAIQYYEDYLNDAGVENEEEVLAALGTPEELAASIREGLKEGNEQQGEFSEKGFFEKGEKLENEVARREDAGKKNDADAKEAFKENAEQEKKGADFAKDGGYRQNAGQGSGANGAGRTSDGRENEKFSGRNRAGYGPSYGANRPGSGRTGSLNERYRGRQRGNMNALFILLAILAAPVVLPIVFALAVVVVVLIFVAVLLTGIFLLTGVICVVAGIAAIVEAFMKLFVYPAGAVLVIGISLMVVGFGLLFTVAMAGIIGKVIPGMFRGLANGIGGLFHRKRG